MVTTTRTASTVTSNTRAALLILEHAERTGLPLPYDVQTHDASPKVYLQFGSLAAVTEWAAWLDQPIGEYVTDTHVHHSVQGIALEQPIRCVYLAPKAADQ